MIRDLLRFVFLFCSVSPVFVLLLTNAAVADSLPRSGKVTGEPWVRHTIDNSSKGADGVKLADVNGDGLLDMATGWEEGGVVKVYLNPGPSGVKNPWPSIAVGQVGSPEDAVLVDLDGDGALEVISATEGAQRMVYIHWAPSPPADYGDVSLWHTSALPASSGRQWLFLHPFQVDGLRGIDIVAGGKNDDAWIGWFECPDDPRSVGAWKWHPFHSANWIMTISQLDLNSDPLLDIVYTERKGDAPGVYWLQNPGTTGTEEWARHPIGGSGREVMFLDTEDLNSDGKLDFAVATRDGGVLVFEGATSAGTWHESEIPMPENTGTGKGVAVANMDGDGPKEIVVSCENAQDAHGVFLFDKHEEAWNARAISGLAGTKFDLVQLLDLDADGDLDVITCEERENLGVIWYENPAPRL
ncbi:MAG: hypothetical protein AMXMBFR84_49270 [Candidatus Hydrogenedentota bacterium]